MTAKKQKEMAENLVKLVARKKHFIQKTIFWVLTFDVLKNSAPTSAIFKTLKLSNSGGAVIRSDPTDFAHLLYPILRVVLPSKYVCRH